MTRELQCPSYPYEGTLPKKKALAKLCEIRCHNDKISLLRRSERMFYLVPCRKGVGRVKLREGREYGFGASYRTSEIQTPSKQKMASAGVKQSPHSSSAQKRESRRRDGGKFLEKRKGKDRTPFAASFY